MRCAILRLMSMGGSRWLGRGPCGTLCLHMVLTARALLRADIHCSNHSLDRLVEFALQTHIPNILSNHLRLTSQPSRKDHLPWVSIKCGSQSSCNQVYQGVFSPFRPHTEPNHPTSLCDHLRVDLRRPLSLSSRILHTPSLGRKMRLVDSEGPVQARFLCHSTPRKEVPPLQHRHGLRNLSAAPVPSLQYQSDCPQLPFHFWNSSLDTHISLRCHDAGIVGSVITLVLRYADHRLFIWLLPPRAQETIPCTLDVLYCGATHQTHTHGALSVARALCMFTSWPSVHWWFHQHAAPFTASRLRSPHALRAQFALLASHR